MTIIQIPENMKFAEVLKESDTLRLVRLSFQDSSYTGIQEQLAELGVGGVILHTMRSEKKSKLFRLSVEEMDTLALAWLQFRQDQAEREARELAEYDAEQAKLLADCQLLAKACGVELKHENDQWYALIFPSELQHLDRDFSRPSTQIDLDAVQFRLEHIAPLLYIDIEVVRKAAKAEAEEIAANFNLHEAQS